MDYKKIFKRETKVIAYVVICLTLVVIGTSYALFLQVSNNSNNQIVKAGSLTITYSGGNTISTENNNCLEPKGDLEGSGNGGCNFELSITNEGTLPMQYDLLIYDNEKNSAGETLASHEFIRHSLKKQYNSDESSETISEIATLNELSSYNSTSKKILETNQINPGETIVFLLKIWIDEEADESIVGQTVNLKLDVVGTVYEESVLSLSENVELGDYVKMTPTATSYGISGDKTGCIDTSYCNGVVNQTIHPSELDIWRVINKNEDGTIELVSEYISNEDFYFYGVTGYVNYVGVLNEIAASYENSKYTIGSRYMGYNGQTEYITDPSKFTTTVPWLSSTEHHGNQYESQGGGDLLDETDINLVISSCGNLIANKQKTNEAKEYYLASRLYYYNGNGYYVLEPHTVNRSGSSVNRSATLVSHYNDEFSESGYTVSAIRPILILKSGIQAEGGGTSENPWVLKK